MFVQLTWASPRGGTRAHGSKVVTVSVSVQDIENAAYYNQHYYNSYDPYYGGYYYDDYYDPYYSAPSAYDDYYDSTDFYGDNYRYPDSTMVN
jgi:hypothetical protein